MGPAASPCTCPKRCLLQGNFWISDLRRIRRIKGGIIDTINAHGDNGGQVCGGGECQRRKSCRVCMYYLLARAG